MDDVLTENVFVTITSKEKTVLYLYAIVMEEESVFTIKNVYAMMDFSVSIVKR
jgi:hypothetical protein